MPQVHATNLKIVPTLTPVEKALSLANTSDGINVIAEAKVADRLCLVGRAAGV